jgi:hypothetical protein
VSSSEVGRRTAGVPAGSAHVNPVDALAARWADAVAGTSYVPLQPEEVEELLRGLLHRLLAAVDEPPAVRGAVGGQVGAALVDAHFTNPESLSQTLCVLLEGRPGSGTAAGRAELADQPGVVRDLAPPERRYRRSGHIKLTLHEPCLFRELAGPSCPAWTCPHPS